MKKTLVMLLIACVAFAGCGRQTKKQEVKEYNPNGEILMENILVEDVLVENVTVEDIQVEGVHVEGIHVEPAKVKTYENSSTTWDDVK